MNIIIINKYVLVYIYIKIIICKILSCNPYFKFTESNLYFNTVLFVTIDIFLNILTFDL